MLVKVWLVLPLASRALVVNPATGGVRTLLSSQGRVRVVGWAQENNPVSYLSSVEAADAEKKWKEGDENAPMDARAHVQTTDMVNGAPENYEGFVDGDGFDGGDGQVGVVGDGTNAMETFDQSQRVKARSNAIGGSESKQNRANVWGYSTGYADELKKKGMVDVDEYGEDRMQARRQQLENWRNQREVRLQKESQIRDMYSLQGKSYNSAAAQGSYLSQFETTPKSTEPQEQFVLVPKPTSDGHLEIHASVNGRGGTSLKIQNEYSTYDDFRAGFAAGSHPAITVEPTTGVLNRRGGEPQEFVLKFNPEVVGQTEYRAVFVVETEDHKWTYTVGGILD